MQTTASFLTTYKQNHKLGIRLISPTFGHIPSLVADSYPLTHRKTHYFLLFMIQGHAHHGVDLQQFDITNNELLFIFPHQIHRLPTTGHGTDYFKMAFDEDCLSLLPKQYPFLINPFNNQKIQFNETTAARLQSIFKCLLELLRVMDSDPDLILAHFNSLLTEINAVYFSSNKNLADDKLSKFIRFKRFVEDNLTDGQSIKDIAEKLSLNTNSLYNIVKHYAGVSPKEFITNRIILEAKRRLYYAESASIKELAYELGFNDPEYFSRLFKKVTGKTIGTFVQDLSGN